MNSYVTYMAPGDSSRICHSSESADKTRRSNPVSVVVITRYLLWRLRRSFKRAHHLPFWLPFTMSSFWQRQVWNETDLLAIHQRIFEVLCDFLNVLQQGVSRITATCCGAICEFGILLLWATHLLRFKQRSVMSPLNWYYKIFNCLFYFYFHFLNYSTFNCQKAKQLFITIK